MGAGLSVVCVFLCLFSHHNTRHSPILALPARTFVSQATYLTTTGKPGTTHAFSETKTKIKRNEHPNQTKKTQVKLVLAAAMWMRPHLLVLDEPTNYLDREALGALTLGIKEFGGGVIIISHNAEFLNAITTETWLLEGGRLQTIGGAKEVRGRDEEIGRAPWVQGPPRGLHHIFWSTGAT